MEIRFKNNDNGFSVIRKSVLFNSIIISVFYFWQITNGMISNILFCIFALLMVLFCLQRRNNVVYLAFFLLIMQKCFQYKFENTIYITPITYVDEIVELITVILVLLYVIKNSIYLERIEKQSFGFFFSYIIVALISTAIYRYSSFVNAFLDLFVCAKFIVFYFWGRLILRSVKYDRIFKQELKDFARINAVWLVLLSLHDLFLAPIFPKFDYRFFTYSLQLCFQHPTYLAAATITMMSLLMIDFQRKDLKYLVLLSVVTLLTFRTKAIGAIFGVAILYLAFVKLNIRYKKSIMLLVSFVFLISASDSFNKYFTAGEYTPIRLKLLRDGFDIANKHFPLGSGFATFGTTVAFSTKSFFYNLYGYTSGYYSNQPVADCFWNGVFAESGYIGALFFILGTVFLVMFALKQFQNNKFSGWCILSILVYTLITSTSETSFFNPAIAVLFIIAGYSVCDSRKMKT